MQLKAIDQSRYNRHVKLTFLAICSFMLVVAVTASSLLIHFWGGPEGTNFWLNTLGVCIAAIALSALIIPLRHHPFFTEVLYVWQVKGELNCIYRKQRQIKAAAEQGDPIAMAILDFSYRASRQVYELDNNTLTLEELDTAEHLLLQQREKWQINTLAHYSRELLTRF